MAKATHFAPAAKSLKLRLLAIAAAVAAIVVVLKLTGALDYLSFAELARNRDWLVGRVEELGLAAPIVFILVYALCTALSLPTGLLLSTLSGFLFGTWLGGLVNVVGATLGATLIFLAARTALGDLLRARAGPFLRKLEAGFREDELSYMLVLRLVPLFPFWLVNLAPAFLGVPPLDLRHRHSGRHHSGGLGLRQRRNGPGCHPGQRRHAGRLRAARAARPAVHHWPRRLGADPGHLQTVPAHLVPHHGEAVMSGMYLDVDLCVIGAGSGGLSVAAGAAQLGASTVLIERHKMGGDCLNTGCVPSKALLAAAKVARGWRSAQAFGVGYAPPRVDFAAVSRHVHEVIAAIAPNDSVERFESLGVKVIKGTGRFVGPREVMVDGTRIRARRFVIATGSSAAVPPIPGLDRVPYFTNETVFEDTELPRHLIIIGGGPIGLEMAQAHQSLGSAVTVLEAARVLPKDDPELVQLLRQHLVAQGIAIRELVKIARVEPEGSSVVAVLETKDGHEERVAGSHLLIAAGRRPNTAGLDLEKAGIAYGPSGITVDARLRTSNRRVFAIGDVAGGPQFTHVAGYHAGIVIRNALFRLPAKVDYRSLPRVTFIDPELAHVGLTEEQARATHANDITILRWPYHENDRAQTERTTYGLVKVVTTKSGKILGASILGAHSGELIQVWVVAISQGLNIKALAGMIAPYPTLGEINKRAAGAFFTPKLFSNGTKRLVRFLAHFG